ncbi:uncharacterized protein LOC132164772 [Corylus avellana]|uniref:uncharacterized protein LOC132164772 n=1 Tax=Corylus avellana TaxID=13451 RepID=UPI00286BF429|nr:uncharacterized protein LOC132164772 [Corylus avellana]
MSPLSKRYLFAYNSLQALGWAFALSRILSSFVFTKSIHGAYASAGELIWLLEAFQFLEVVHAAIGIVPSGVWTTFIQWEGRIIFLLAVHQIDEVQELPTIFTTLVAWSLAEIIRYPHYALNCIGKCPSWMTYLRYSAFTVLYPIGIPGEMWLAYQALPFIKKKDLLFSGLPFSYYSYHKLHLLCCPYPNLKLYQHMLKQRRSKLGKLHKKEKI